MHMAHVRLAALLLGLVGLACAAEGDAEQTPGVEADAGPPATDAEAADATAPPTDGGADPDVAPPADAARRDAEVVADVQPTPDADGPTDAGPGADLSPETPDLGPPPGWPELPADGLAREVEDFVRGGPGTHHDRGPGDLLLVGSQGAFAVQGFHRPQGWGPGFSVLDAIYGSPEEGTERFQELMPMVGTGLYSRGLAPRAVESFDPGAADRPARIRLQMDMVGVPLLDAVVGVPVPAFALDVALELGFEPDGLALELVTEVVNRGERSFRLDVGDGALWGDRMQLYAPGVGEGVTDLLISLQPLVAAWSPGEVALGLVSEAESLRVVAQDELTIALAPIVDLAPGETYRYRRWLVVGPGDLDALLVRLRARQGGWPDHTPVHGVVRGGPATVYAEAGDGSGAVSRTATDDAGAYTLHLPAGAFTLQAMAADGRRAGPLEVTVPAEGEAPAAPALQLPEWGQLEVLTHRAGEERALPARVMLHPSADANPFGAAPRTEFSAGRIVVGHAPGPVTVVASRGFEYQLAYTTAEVRVGETTTVELELEPVMERRAWVSADLHVHTEVSVDSGARVEDRVTNYAAEGVDLLVVTDHDAATELSGLIEPLGLSGWLRTAPGAEVSPLYGHVNGFPLSVEGLGTDRWRAYWPVDWSVYTADGLFVRNYTPPELFTRLREQAGARVVQINHPRADQGLFEYARFDPLTGIAGVPEGRLDGGFDALEVLNGKRMDATASTLPDWYALLNEGWRVAITGNSDSHTIEGRAGYPRNLVPVSTQDLEALELEEVWQGLLGLHSAVCGGPLLEVEASSPGREQVVGPGTLLSAEGGAVELHLRVHAAEFVPTGRAIVVVNGVLDEPLAVPAGQQPLRLDTWLDLRVDADSWIVVLIEGDGGLSPLVPGAASLAVSNPIYVDADGDGAWTAPGL